jgi:hypothetical protein
MVEVPGDTPVATPELTPTVATAVTLLVQMPPVGVDDRLDVVPTQKVNVPVIGVGSGLTVTTLVIAHNAPGPKEYVIVAVPAILPVTTPEEEPIIALLLLDAHVPPATAFANVVVDPTQTEAVPVIADGVGYIVTTFVTKQPTPTV